jgi:hypothetical protein
MAAPVMNSEIVQVRIEARVAELRLLAAWTALLHRNAVLDGGATGLAPRPLRLPPRRSGATGSRTSDQ